MSKGFAVVLPDQVRQTILSYLAHQSKKNVPSIVAGIEDERRRLLSLLPDISEEQARFVPSAGRWSIRDVVQHVVAFEREVVEVIASLAGATAPPDEPPTSGCSLAELRQRLTALRAQLLSLVGGLAEDANPEARHEHFLLGPLWWKEWLASLRVHDRDHIGQIEAIQQMPMYPDTPR
jgi:hypothetical protein